MKRLLLILVITLSFKGAIAQPSFTTQNSESRCVNTGTITVNATGTGTISYQITTGPLCAGITYPVNNGTNNVFSSLCPGTYTVAVTDVVGTTTQTSVITGSYIVPTLSLTSSSPFCFGGNDGTLLATASDGRLNYTYQLYNSSQTPGVSTPLQTIVSSNTTDTFMNLVADTYTVVLTDSCGSQQTVSHTLSNPAAGQIDISSPILNSPQLVNNCMDAIYVAEINFSSAGMPPYTYEALSGGVVVASFSGETALSKSFTLPISGQPYTLRVIDTCGSMDSVLVGWLDKSFVNTTNLGCNTFDVVVGNLDTYGDSVTVTMVDSNNNSFTPGLQMGGIVTFSNVPYSAYTITITNECNQSKQFMVSESASSGINILGVNKGPDDCIGLARANISIQTISGPTPWNWTLTSYPASYTGNISNTISQAFGGSYAVSLGGLTVGTYTFEITDACNAKDSVSFTINPSDLLQFTFNPVGNTGCSGNNASVSWSATTNSSSPTGLNYLVRVRQSNASGPLLTSQGGAQLINGQLSNLAAGTYYVELVNVFCGANTPGPWTVVIPPYIQPSFNPLFGVNCTGGTVTIQGSGLDGVAPYNFKLYTVAQTPGIDPPLDSILNVGSFQFTGLNPANSYQVQITDSCGNGFASAVSLSANLQMAVTASCIDTMTRLSTDFLAGATFSWTKGSDPTVLSNTNYLDFPSVISPTDAGTYKVRAVIAGCFSDSVVYNLTAPGPCVPLPVHLLSLNAYVVGSDVQLIWESADEDGFDYFVLERKTVSGEWKYINKVFGKGLSGNNYSFTDHGPANGTNYYRLKMVDKNGNYTYSNIVIAKLKTIKKIVEISPNPSNGIINLHFGVKLDRGYRIQFLNTVGQIVYELKDDAVRKYETRSLNLHSVLPSGVYNVLIYTRAGIEPITERVVIDNY